MTSYNLNEVAIFRITDGTQAGTVDLLQWLESWRPATAPNRITWRSSPFADGRQPVLAAKDNITDTISLNPSGNGSAPQLIFETSLLREVLEKAVDYWTADWPAPFVWMEVRAECEENVRYAIIMDYRTPNDGAPFSKEFNDGIFSGWPLVVEHGGWTEHAPSVADAIEIGAAATYDGRYLGNVDALGAYAPSDNDYAVYFGNHLKVANLTDIYHYDASGAVYSANLMDAALPTTLFPSPVGVNDACYFGIDTSLANSGPFSSLVFNISTAQLDIYPMTWQYWNGATWTNLTVMQDNTDANGAISGFPFDTPGIRAVSWEIPGWGTTTVNGITGWWVRVVVGTPTGAGSIPAVATKVYTVSWPYTDIAADQVGGNTDAIARAIFRNHCDSDSFQILSQNRMIAAQRRISRGADFAAFLNVGTQLAAGISITNLTSTALVTDVSSHTGDARQYSGSGATYQRAFRITIDATRSVQYYGTFRVFIRTALSGGTGGDLFEGYVSLALGVSNNVVSETERSEIAQAAPYNGTDLGTITIPDAGVSGFAAIHFDVWLRHPTGTGNLNVSDIIIMPADEMIVDSIDPQISSAAAMQKISGNTKIGLQVDAISYPKDGLRSVALDNDNGDYYGEWTAIARNTAKISKGEALRWWFFSLSSLGVASPNQDAANNEFLNSIVMEKNQRYFSMRGNQ